MHVVMLTNNAAPEKLGGLERYVTELSANLVRLGVEVTLVAKAPQGAGGSDAVAEDGVRVIRYPVPSKQDPLFAARYPSAVARGVRTSLGRVGPHDVLHCHFPVPALLPVLQRRPFLYTLHAPVWRELLVERQGSYLLPRPAQRAARAGLRQAERQVVRRADRILTLSRFMQSEVALLDPAAGARVDVLAGGVDTTRFVPPPVADGAVEGAPRLFTARRLVPRTGVAQLVEAMPRVVEALPGVRLDIAGDGLQREAIGDTITRLGLQDSVRLLGRVPEAELVRGYQAADLAVTPTQELEGFGLSTAEALACGTPCLVTPAGANPEVVAGLRPELVTRDTTPEALADGIIDWFRVPVDQRPDGSTCRSQVEPRMSWPDVAARHLEIYRAAARPSSPLV